MQDDESITRNGRNVQGIAECWFGMPCTPEPVAIPFEEQIGGKGQQAYLIEGAKMIIGRNYMPTSAILCEIFFIKKFLPIE